MPDIPLRLAYRILADCLDGHAARLRRRPRGGGRHARPGSSGARAEGQARRAAECGRQALAIAGLIGDLGAYAGTIDAAVLGYLAGCCYGDGACWRELAAELEDLGRPGLLAGLAADDLPGIVARVVGFDPPAGPG